MSWRCIISFDVADEIANNFNQIGIVVGNLHACECIFDQYHQLEAIITVYAEFTEVRLIGNSFDINAEILSNQTAHFVRIKSLLWCSSLSYAPAAEGRSDASFESLST